MWRAVDLETTGLEDDAQPVEIGYADVLPGGPSGPWGHLIDPGIPIPAAASGIHHIVDADVQGCPRWPDAVARLIDEARDVDGWLAHNAAYERRLISDAITDGKPWVDTWKVACRVFPDAPDHKLQTLRYWLDLPVDRAIADLSHRAPGDAYVCAHLFVRLQGLASMEKMQAWSAKPCLMPRIHFGMHAGQRWCDLPRSYLEWILKKGDDFDADVQYTARADIWFRDNQKGPHGPQEGDRQ